MSIGHRILEWLFGPRAAELMTPGLNLWLTLVSSGIVIILVGLLAAFVMWFATTPAMDAFYSAVFEWLGIWKRGRS